MKGEGHITSDRRNTNNSPIFLFLHLWNKRHDGISLPTLSIILIALSLWLVYGVLIDSFAVFISNILAILFIGVVVVGVIRLRRSESD